MNDVQILNRQILTFMDKNPEFYPEKSWALIRFFNPGSPYKLTLPESCKANLEIICDDVSNVKMEHAERYTFFCEDDAEKILKFIEKHHKDFDLLICACEAGISRSAGCGAAIEKIYLDIDSIYSSTKFFPNSLIYRTILNSYYKVKW